MELRMIDSEYMIRNEYRQLSEKDNVFAQTKNIITKTSSVTREYIIIAYLWSKISRYIDLFRLVLNYKTSNKELIKTYYKLCELEATFEGYLKSSEKSCLKAWEDVFLKAPDLVQQYFFDEVLKIDKKNIGLVLSEILFHVCKTAREEDGIKEDSLKDFLCMMKKMLKDVYNLK